MAVMAVINRRTGEKYISWRTELKKASTYIFAAAIYVALSTALPAAVHAHGEDDSLAKANAEISTEEYGFGRQGDPKNVTRTIAIDMSDRMRFSPAETTVREGETIRFVVTNKGKMLHEMVIGTMHELKAHADLMEKHPGMEHDEPYMAHVKAGEMQELVWQFTKGGEFYFACLIPGHFEAGMLGKIKVSQG